MDFTLVLKNSEMLLIGAMETLQVAFGALALGLVLGIMTGTCRISRKLFVRSLADAYTHVAANFLFLSGIPSDLHDDNRAGHHT